MSRGITGMFACTVFALMLGGSGPGWAGPQIQQWTAPSGARVLFVQSRELPIVDVRIAFDAGSARDGDQPGIATFANHMLLQGAGEWDAGEIAARFEEVGANVNQGVERDMATLGFRSLSESEALAQSRDTLIKVLHAPAFSDADVKRERERMLVALRQQEQSPGDVAKRAFYEAVFGDHPYAGDPLGNLESVAAMEAHDLRKFHRRYYTAANAVVALVGDLDRAQAERLAERLTAQLPAGRRADPLPEVDDLSEAKTLRIDHPSSQSHILIGAPGMYRGHPDYFALYLGNHALGGGGLVSRLSDEVREKRGLSYSVYSYFSPMARKGPFVMGMQTRNDQVDQGVQVLREQLETFVSDGPTAEELEASVKNLTGGFPLRIDSNQKILEYLTVIGFYGLPLDYLDRFVGRIEAVERAQITRAFDDRLDPDAMVTVIVGGD